jgi:hypothetical protein
VVGGCSVKLPQNEGGRKSAPGDASKPAKTHKELLHDMLTPTYYLSVAAVPLDQVEKWLEHCIESCDLVVLMFQCGKASSLQTCLALESRLPENVPRVYVASKTDLIFTSQALNMHSISSNSLKGEYGNETKSSRESLKASHESVLQTASLHIKERSLPALAMFSTLTGEGTGDVTSLIIDVATEPAKGVPPRKRKSSGNYPSIHAVMAVTSVMLGALTISLAVRYQKEVKDWFNHMVDSTRSFFSAGLLTN